ncbi:MAG: hypothetical protein KIT56_08165 [Gammaproteobacteria bacterium]|nr:hypothetical protein [Gammaproteobacteria bacterium]MCW5583835.1 hypothetical protein [Gammaproteobacteria bacterium]
MQRQDTHSLYYINPITTYFANVPVVSSCVVAFTNEGHMDLKSGSIMTTIIEIKKALASHLIRMQVQSEVDKIILTFTGPLDCNVIELLSPLSKKINLSCVIGEHNQNALFQHLRVINRYLKYPNIADLLKKYKNVNNNMDLFIKKLTVNYHDTMINFIKEVESGDSLYRIQTYLKEVEEILSKIRQVMEFFEKSIKDPEKESQKISFYGLYNITLELHRALQEKHQELIRLLNPREINLESLKNAVQSLLHAHQCDGSRLEDVLSLKAVSPILTCWLLKNIFTIMQENKLLNNDNVTCLIEKITQVAQVEKFIFFVSEILARLDQTKILDVSLFKKVVTEEFMDRSCQARLKGNGLDSVDTKKEQQYWSVYSEYAIQWVNTAVKEKSLLEMMIYLSDFRHKVAVSSCHNTAKDFGVYRTEEQGDIYSNAGYSVVSKEVLLSVFQLTRTSIRDLFVPSNMQVRVTQKQSCVGQGERKRIYLTLKDAVWGEVKFPDRIIDLYQGESNNVRIETGFSTLSQEEYEKCIHILDKQYLQPLSQSKGVNDDCLEKLGELAYYLCVLYPYKRGTAAIVQWIICGQIERLLGIKISQVLLGEKQDIPFDIYAHLSSDPKKYAAEFKRIISSLSLNMRAAKTPFMNG